MLVLRADGGAAGLGHIMRCVALAEAWRARSGQAVLVVPTLPAWLDDRLRRQQIPVVAAPHDPGSNEDLRMLVSTALERRAHVVVVDGYCFHSDFQSGLVDNGWSVGVLDDHGSMVRYHADVVIDQNLGADEGLYRNRPVNSRLLLGTRYALVRSEFTRAETHRHMGHSNHLLVALGGCPDPYSSDLMDAVVTLLGEQFEIRESSRGRIQDMAEAMSWADLALAAAGSISWELCLMGVPTLAFSVVDNQERVRRELGRHGVAVDLGEVRSLTAPAIADAVIALAHDSNRRTAMTERARRLVDGKGPGRVVTALRATMIDLVAAGPHHEALLFEWANDPSVRRWAFSEKPIDWDEHRSWFARKLKDENCTIFIALMDTHEVGQVRFDCVDHQAVVSVSMSPAWRGMGLGGAVIQAATLRVAADRRLEGITAEILAENVASIRCFESAGYERCGRRDSPRGEVLSYRSTVGVESTSPPGQSR